MTIRKQYLPLLICFAFNTAALAQPNAAWIITTQPLQLLCRDLPVTAERMYRRHTLGFTLGYRSDATRADNPNHIIGGAVGAYPGFTAPRFKAVTL